MLNLKLSEVERMQLADQIVDEEYGEPSWLVEQDHVAMKDAGVLKQLAWCAAPSLLVSACCAAVLWVVFA